MSHVYKFLVAKFRFHLYKTTIFSLNIQEGLCRISGKRKLPALAKRVPDLPAPVKYYSFIIRLMNINVVSGRANY
jgi:hypothetical protein